MFKFAATSKDLELQLANINQLISSLEKQQRDIGAEGDQDKISAIAVELKNAQREKKNVDLQIKKIKQKERLDKIPTVTAPTTSPPVSAVAEVSEAQEFLLGIAGVPGWYFGDKANVPGDMKYYGPFKDKLLADVFRQYHANEHSSDDIKFFDKDQIKMFGEQGFSFLLPDQAEWITNEYVKTFKDIVSFVEQFYTQSFLESPPTPAPKAEEAKPEPISATPPPNPHERSSASLDEEVESLKVKLREKEKKYIDAAGAYADCISKLKYNPLEDEIFDDEEEELIQQSSGCDHLRIARDEAKKAFDVVSAELNGRINSLLVQKNKIQMAEKDRILEEEFAQIRNAEEAVEKIRDRLVVKNTPEGIAERYKLQKAELNRLYILVQKVDKQYEQWIKNKDDILNNVAECKYEYVAVNNDVLLLSQYNVELDENKVVVDNLIVQYINLLKDKFFAKIVAQENFAKQYEEILFSNFVLDHSSLKNIDKQIEQISGSKRKDKKEVLKLLDLGKEKLRDDIARNIILKKNPRDFEALKKQDKLFVALSGLLNNYTKVRIKNTKTIEELKTFQTELMEIIRKNISKDEWSDFKKGIDALRVPDIVFVANISDFIKNFDPAFKEGNPNKVFRFHSFFVEDPRNIKLIKDYLMIYYTKSAVWPWIIENKIDLGDIPDATKRMLRGPIEHINSLEEERKNAEESGDEKLVKKINSDINKIRKEIEKPSILDSIAIRFDEDPHGKAADVLKDKLISLLDRIFEIGIPDPEDINSFYKTELDKINGNKSKVLFRTINQGLNKYIYISLQNALIDAKQKMSIRILNCPYFDCKGKFQLNLGQGTTEKERREIFKRWREGGADEGIEMSKCDRCHRPIAGRFVNCPNCLSAVPLSSTYEAWTDPKYNLSAGDQLNYKQEDDPAMTKFIEEYAPKIQGLFSNHIKQYRTRTIKDFIEKLIQYVDILNRNIELNPDNRRLIGEVEKVNKVYEVLQRGLPPELLEGTIDDLSDFFAKNSTVFNEFDYLLKKFMSRGKFIVAQYYNHSDIYKISSEVGERKKCLHDIFDIFGSNEFMKKIAQKKRLVRSTNLQYKSIDMDSLRFEADIDLVCPNCRFGINKGEFNPSKLARVFMSFVTKGRGADETKSFGRKLENKIDNEGILLGNTEGVDINIADRFGDVPIEMQPKYKVSIQRFKNAGFRVTNLGNNYIFVGVHEKKKLYRGATATVSTGGTITIGNLSYKLHSGIFFVRPKMYYRGEVQDNVGIDAEEAQARGNVSGDIFGFGYGNVVEDNVENYRTREAREAVEERAERVMEKAYLLLDVYCKRKNSDQDMTVSKYLASIEDEEERQSEAQILKEIGMEWFDRIGVAPGDLTKLQFVDEDKVRILKDIILDRLIPEGTNERDIKIAESSRDIDALLDIYNRKQELKEDRVNLTREKEYLDEDEYEARTRTIEDEELELDERQKDLESRIVYNVSGVKHDNNVLLNDFISQFGKIYDVGNYDEKFVLYDVYSPHKYNDDGNPKPLMDGDFLDRHLLKNYEIMVALKAMNNRFKMVPAEAKEESNIGFSKDNGDSLGQTLSGLNDVFIIKDDKDESTELADVIKFREGFTNYKQMVFEDAIGIFSNQLRANPGLFSVEHEKGVGARTFIGQREFGVLEEEKFRPASVLYPFSYASVVEKNSRSIGKYSTFDFKASFFRDSFIIKINSIKKTIDGENLLEGREDEAVSLRGFIYFTKSFGFSIGDMIYVSGYVLKDSFYSLTAKSILGSVFGKIFGDKFVYNIGVPHKTEDLFFHSLIYDLGLDKKLNELYIKLKDERIPGILKQLRIIKNHYAVVINRLNGISAKKGLRPPTYIHALSLIPPEKKKEFLELIRWYILNPGIDFRAIEEKFYSFF